MAINKIKSSIFDAGAQIIAHQVNCQGVMGSGVAKQIRDRYPKVYSSYKHFCDLYKDNRNSLLGKCQIVVDDYDDFDLWPRHCVANLFGQYNFGRDGKRYTDYAALMCALSALAEYADNYKLTVAMPYKMGCDRGGGDWDNMVYPAIVSHLQNIDVLICELP